MWVQAVGSVAVWRVSCRNSERIIYTTKIDEFVCPPNISETVAVRIMKLAHRPRIASATIKLISKPILLSILSILLKTTFGQKCKSSTPSVGFRFVDIFVLPSGRSICIILFSLLIRPYVLLRRIEMWWAAYSNYSCTSIYNVTPLLTSIHTWTRTDTGPL